MDAGLAQGLFGLADFAVVPLEGPQLLGDLGQDGGPSTSAFLTQSCSICGVQPILVAIDVTAAQRDGCLLA
jgi:hypothetical protein